MRCVRKIGAWGFMYLATGLAMGQAGVSAESCKVLTDFENGPGQYVALKNGTAVKPCAELSGQAAYLPAKGTLFYQQPRGMDWSQYDLIKMDIQNPSKENVRLYLCLKDDSSPHGYYSWINRYLSVRGGKSTLELNMRALRRGEGTPKDNTDPRPFHWNSLKQVYFLAQGNVYVDNIRLEKVSLKTFDGLHAFDFGPVNSAPLLGYTLVTPNTAYTKAQGYGWTRKGGMWARERKNPPDIFFGDWVSTNGGVFSVDVPNGTYKIWVGWTDPGEWEFTPAYTHRSVHAEGKLLLEEKVSGQQYLDRVFRHADMEDHPGEDIRAKYCTHYKLHPLEATVEDGQLNLTFKGSGQYAATINGLIIYPKDKSDAGEAFVQESDKRREKEYHDKWLEKMSARQEPDKDVIAKSQTPGFALFHRDLSKDVNYYDAPQSGEGITGALSAFASLGETEPFTFSVYARKDLEGIRVTLAPFAGPNGNALPADAVSVRYLSWKFRREANTGGQYRIKPFILRKMKLISAPAGTPRRFWITVRVPKDAKPGTYRSTATVSTKNAGSAQIPLTLTVLNFTLPEADMGLALFGVGATTPCSTYFWDDLGPFLQNARRKSLTYARDYGMTYIALTSRQAFKGLDGTKARFDMTALKRQYGECKALGFTHIDIIGPSGGLFTQAAMGNEKVAKQKGFGSADEMVKALFGGFREACQRAGLSDPIWRMGDEPPESVAPKFVDMYSRIKRVAGAASSISMSPHRTNQKKLLDVMKFPCLNQATLEDMQRATRAGNHLYVNNQGCNRWAFGVWMCKLHTIGVLAYRQFAWMSVHIDPYYPLDGHEDDLGLVFPDRQHELRNLEGLERVREGIDDYRYLQLLRQLAETHKTRPAAKEAAAFRAAILEKAAFTDTRIGRKPKMTETELNQMRRKAADLILKLLKR